MNAPIVVAVTVTYGDRFGFLDAVAKRVLGDAGIARWIIVTNGVAPQLAQKIAGLGGSVITRSFVRNVGSAPAYAAGIQAALACDADWVWLLDDDNLPAADALKRLLAAGRALARAGAQRSDIAVCAYREHVHGPLLRHGPRVRSSFLGFHVRGLLPRLLRPLRRPGQWPPTLAVASAPYGGLLLPRELIARIGLPDRRFVLYADDTEYTDRIMRGGGGLYVVTDAQITDLAPSWRSRSCALRAWLDEPDSARIYYGARNEAWFDSHRLVRSRWLYRLHRSLYCAAWWLLSRREPRRARYALLREAVRAGEDGVLGCDPRYPLDSAPLSLS